MGTATASKIGYRFGGFELDLTRGALLQAGQRCPLRSQSFQTLRYLVEHPGAVLGKDELARAVGHAVAVSDNSLAHCITEIRRALGDDPRQPRFIQTLPRAGYRFVAPIRPWHATQPSLLALPDCTPSSVIGLPVVHGSLLRALATGCTALLLFLSGDQFPQHRPAPALASLPVTHRTLAVFPLVDQTGRTELAWLAPGLTEILSSDLAQLKPIEANTHWKVISPAKPHTAMAGNAASLLPLIESQAQLALQSSASVFAAGSIAAQGTEIDLSVELHDAMDGHQLAAIRMTVSGLNQVLPATHQLAAELGRRIGLAVAYRPAPTIRRTDNIEAYRWYTLGREHAAHYQNLQAAQEFQHAMKLDPGFALACFHLAETDRMLERRANAKHAFQQFLRDVPATDNANPMVLEARRNLELPH